MFRSEPGIVRPIKQQSLVAVWVHLDRISQFYELYTVFAEFRTRKMYQAGAIIHHVTL